MCILMSKGLAVFLNSFLLLQIFWGKKYKNRLFVRKNSFESSFYKIDVYVLTNWSVRLENFAYG